MRKLSTQPNKTSTKERIVHFTNKLMDLHKQRNEIDKDINYYETLLFNLEQSNKDNRLVIPQTGSGVRVKRVAETILNNNQNNY